MLVRVLLAQSLLARLVQEIRSILPASAHGFLESGAHERRFMHAGEKPFGAATTPAVAQRAATHYLVAVAPIWRRRRWLGPAFSIAAYDNRLSIRRRPDDGLRSC